MNKKGKVEIWAIIIIGILVLWAIISSVGWANTSSSLNEKIRDCEDERLKYKSLYENSLENITDLNNKLSEIEDKNKYLERDLSSCKSSLEKFNIGDIYINPITATYILLTFSVTISLIFIIHLIKVKIYISKSPKKKR